VKSGGNLFSSASAISLPRAAGDSRNPQLAAIRWSDIDNTLIDYNGIFGAKMSHISVDCQHQCSGVEFGGAQMSVMDHVTVRAIASATPSWVTGTRDGASPLSDPESFGIRVMAGSNGLVIRDCDVFGVLDYYVGDATPDVVAWDSGDAEEDYTRHGFWFDQNTETTLVNVKPENLSISIFSFTAHVVGTGIANEANRGGPFIDIRGELGQYLKLDGCNCYEIENELGPGGEHYFMRNESMCPLTTVEGTFRFAMSNAVNREMYTTFGGTHVSDPFSWTPVDIPTYKRPYTHAVAPSNTTFIPYRICGYELPGTHVAAGLVNTSGGNIPYRPYTRPACHEHTIFDTGLTGNGYWWLPHSGGTPIGTKVRYTNNDATYTVTLEPSGIAAAYQEAVDSISGSGVVAAAGGTAEFTLSDFSTWERTA
jgi:hypothetical protein